MDDITTHAVRVRTLPARRDEPDTVAATARRGADLGIGAATLASRALTSTLDRLWPGSTPDHGAPSITRRVARAATGAALATQSRLLDAAETMEQVAHQTVTTARRVPVVRDVLVGIDASIDRWSERADAETGRREEATLEFLAALVPAMTQAVLERVDLPTLVQQLPLAEIIAAVDLPALLDRLDVPTLLDHVDLDAILDRIDVDAVLDHVDVNRVLDRVDPDRLLDRVGVDRLLDRVGVDRLLDRVGVDRLMDRVDVERLLARVDLDAMMAQVDLGPIVDRVLDDVDIGGIVRESTGSITTDAMDGARISAMRLDGFVARIVDRTLLRSGNRARDVSPPPFEDHTP